MTMQHFSPSEFKCGCGQCGFGFESMQPSMLTLLDACREFANVPFVITSSIRCVRHNNAVGGADRSAHVTGHAVDIRAVDNHTRHRILTAAFRLRVPRIGIASSFVHLDNSPHLAADVVWLYGSRS
jgi:zinc D-Ala-D-Ala carboxypeptidase